MLLGCIGDDFTGSSDLANTLAKGGMRVSQYVGTPDKNVSAEVEAGVISLKSRTIAVADAVSQSLHALEWLKAQGCRQFFFKYCSTFDSTAQGNIGPVAEALLKALEAKVAVICPAFPATGRSVYQGHLFVRDALLSESGMEKHPLTPMNDPDIRRWLQRQTPLSVGHVPYQTVATGASAISETMRNMTGLVVVDAILDSDLLEIGAAIADHRLVTGGSGIATGLAANFHRQGLLKQNGRRWRGVHGRAVVLSGSCSDQTRAQIRWHKLQGGVALAVSAEDIVTGKVTAACAVDWALKQEGLPIIYTSADPAVVGLAQNKFGKAKVAERIESFFSEVAETLVQQGVSRLITAGGETSGAVISALDLAELEIGPEIDPGVPALKAEGVNLAVALKSGNFGSDDFFAKAARALEAFHE